jgi:ribose transport system ATP-binding protein
VLRDGKNAAPTAKVEDLDWNSVIKLMIGRTQSNEPFPSRKSEEQPILEVDNLRGDFSPIPASFNLFRGEILGWYGLVGSGRTELARTIIGADVVRSGSIKVKGKEAKIRSVSDALHHWHIGYVSENRQDEGVFLTHSLTRNITVTIWNRLYKFKGWLDVQGEVSSAKQYRDTLGIKSESLNQIVGTLSGGNQQKVSVAKWLASKPEILIIDEPTVGIDIKTKYEIHQLIWELAQEGISILLISSDMPEMIRIADRIMTFRSGRIVGEIANNRDYDTISHQIMKQIVVLEKEHLSNGKIDNQEDNILSV